MYSPNERLSVALLSVTIAFTVGSGIFAVNGAQELIKLSDQSNQIINKAFEQKTDSINSYYQSLIDIETTKINELKVKAQNQWNGIYTPEQGKLITIYESNITTYRTRNENALTEYRNQNNKTLENTGKEVSMDILQFMIFSAIIEILIILSNWFVVFYDKQVCREAHTPSLLNRIKNIFNDYGILSDIVQQNSDNKTTKTETKSERKIGFIIGQNNPNKSGSVSGRIQPEETSELLGYLSGSVGSVSGSKNKKLEQYKEIIKSIKTVDIKEDTLSNKNIKQIQTITRAEYKSRGFIRKVFSIAQVIGLEKFDNEGNLLN
jgi:hypothetical protein